MPLDCNGKQLLISRTDSIGDVLLTLPMVAWLKEQFPTCRITFLCRDYTAPIVRYYEGVDEVLTLETLEAMPSSNRVMYLKERGFDIAIHVFPRKELALLFRKSKIPVRIGTSHRGFHLLNCTHRLNFSRKRSAFHESQLNFELLRPMGIERLPSMEQLNRWATHLRVPKTELPEGIEKGLKKGKAVILHPKSQGSAREWPMESYISLAEALIEKGYTVCFTGTEKEGAFFRHQLPQNDHIIDTTGQLSMEQLLVLIARADALVACSTGPLHIAGFYARRAVGLFSPKVPIHPGRWGALGSRSVSLVNDPTCPACKSKKPCNCIVRIPTDRVLDAIVH